MSPATEAPSDAREPTPRSGPARQAVESLVILSLGILIFRTFAAEAYIVPTGSMAPTLLGNHEEVVCPNCGTRFTLGLDEDGRAGRAVCPNCGQTDSERVPAVACSGDRVLVQKFLYDLRRPRRWEVAVFHHPGAASQPYVKRVVGLPGEAIQIVGGDVVIDGRVARKSLREQRAMRVLVFDNNHVPSDVNRYPRWMLRRGRPSLGRASGWRADGTRFVHEPIDPAADPIDWLEYRHWQPEQARYAPVHDFNPYNGGELRGENRVADLMLEARLDLGGGVRSVVVRIDSGSDRFVVTLPVEDVAPIEVRRNGRLLIPDHPKAGRAATRSAARPVRLEASVMDRRLMVALDGEPLFDPIDYEDPASGPEAGGSPVALGVRGGSLTVGDLRIYRDVYYTTALANIPRRPFGVDSPYVLGPDEFFVLGDNSPVSNDSRFWPASPVVPGELFLGKPFLVHLPGQVVPLQVFGRSLYWVPDPREIRYIR
ncbi:MAG: signal peptidase I [Planctomycetaceae bacterium]